MKSCNPYILFCFSILLFSCNVVQKSTVEKTYPKEQLQHDYVLLRKILESKHPSLYWYTSKDSMDFYFQSYQQRIQDSMTEQEFQWQIIAPLLNKIHCGHTSVMMSKSSSKGNKNKKSPSFPFHLKVWNDTMVITENLIKGDTVFIRGTLLKSINGIESTELISKMLSNLSEDGYAHNVNYVRLSSNFPVAHKYIYGLSNTYDVEYVDAAGKIKKKSVPLFKPVKDSAESIKNAISKKLPKTKRKKIETYRSFSIDSSGKFGLMKLNSFSKGRLRSFFRKSFRSMRKNNIQHLILDIRLNGGGNVSTSTLLTKYIAENPFGVADSVYCLTKTLHPYARYFKGKFLNNIALNVAVRKQKTGQFHLIRYERKLYKPKLKNHYTGNLYVLTSGPTFSASCLFANAVKGQQNVKLIGEETGGGWYGNNGIMIPDVTLPYTRLSVRMPLFRVILYKHADENKGKGIAPDFYIPTSYDAILKNYDKKMQVVKDMIYNSTE